MRVDLLPILLDLLERLDADGGLDALATSCRPTWALRLTETHHLTVPVDRLRALLRVVAELYQGEHRRSRAFPEVRAAALVELDDAFRDAGAPIAWTDPSGHWTFSAIGRNLTNSTYLTTVLPNSGGFGAVYGMPPNYLVEITYKH